MEITYCFCVKEVAHHTFLFCLNTLALRLDKGEQDRLFRKQCEKEDREERQREEKKKEKRRRKRAAKGAAAKYVAAPAAAAADEDLFDLDTL